MSALWLSALAMGGVHLLEEGQVAVIPVNLQTGTIVQLPEAVQLVTPTTHIAVERVDAQGGSRSQGVVPVRHLQVRMAGKGTPQAEMVTFLLASGKGLNARFVPGGAQADSFADVRVQKPRRPRSDDYLAEPIALMRDMFADVPLRRQVVEEQFAYEQVPELEWTLVRIHQSGGFTGYTFVVFNRSERAIELNPAVLSVGQPNRVVLSQVDDEVLGTCRPRSTDPTLAPCRTPLRLVVDGKASDGRPAIRADANMPFIAPVDGVDTGRP